MIAETTWKANPCELEDGYRYGRNPASCCEPWRVTLGVEWYDRGHYVMFTCLDCMGLPDSERTLIEGAYYLRRRIDNAANAALMELTNDS